MPYEPRELRSGEVVRLRREDQPSIYRFLSASPIENVAMMGLLIDEGLSGYGEFYGIRDNGRWVAVAYFGGDISLYATEAWAVDAMAEFAMRRRPIVPRIIARKDIVDQFWQTLSRAPYPLQFDRRQLVYTLDPTDLVAPHEPLLRPALPSEAAEVARLASAMSFEEIQIDPLRDFPLSYMRLVEHRIRLQRYYVLVEDGAIKFQVHLNSITPYAGQITGVYTPPAYRRQGYARRGLGEFCRLAFRRAPRLCLFVNDFNSRAISLYESLGFRCLMEYRAVFMRASG